MRAVAPGDGRCRREPRGEPRVRCSRPAGRDGRRTPPAGRVGARRRARTLRPRPALVRQAVEREPPLGVAGRERDRRCDVRGRPHHPHLPGDLGGVDEDAVSHTKHGRSGRRAARGRHADRVDARPAAQAAHVDAARSRPLVWAMDAGASDGTPDAVSRRPRAAPLRAARSRLPRRRPPAPPGARRRTLIASARSTSPSSTCTAASTAASTSASAPASRAPVRGAPQEPHPHRAFDLVAEHPGQATARALLLDARLRWGARSCAGAQWQRCR